VPSLLAAAAALAVAEPIIRPLCKSNNSESQICSSCVCAYVCRDAEEKEIEISYLSTVHQNRA